MHVAASGYREIELVSLPTPEVARPFGDKLYVGQVIGSFGEGGVQCLAYNIALALVQRGVSSLAITVRSGCVDTEASQCEVPMISLWADRNKPIVLC